MRIDLNALSVEVDMFMSKHLAKLCAGDVERFRQRKNKNTPELNEIAHGIDIGKKRGYDYIYLACKMCGKPRWVKVALANQLNFRNLCRNGCQQKDLANREYAKNPLYWNGISELKVGMVRNSSELGEYYDKKYHDETLIYSECPDCHKRYWREKELFGKYCGKCTYKNKGEFEPHGKDHHFWKGGLSFESYTPEFTETLKERIRKRDNYTCQMCGAKQNGTKLAVHHIDYNKKNCLPNNLISLCAGSKGTVSCHSNTNSNREYWTLFFQNLLKNKQGSFLRSPDVLPYSF